MDPSYKARKEAFVSDLAGGSILEINAVTLVAPVCVFRSLNKNLYCLLTSDLTGSRLLFSFGLSSSPDCPSSHPTVRPHLLSTSY